MDGYAVRAEDTFGAGRDDAKVLRSIETVHTAQVATRAVGAGAFSVHLLELREVPVHLRERELFAQPVAVAVVRVDVDRSLEQECLIQTVQLFANRVLLPSHHEPLYRDRTSADGVPRTADPKPEPISIARCRELLGEDAVDSCDDEVDRIRRCADTVAQAVIEMFFDEKHSRIY